MKVLSLFDGISCGMVALEQAKIPVERYVAYEIEPNAIKISHKNYPKIEHCGDVTKADFTQYHGFDLLMGGSPCQSLSITRGEIRNHLEGKSKLFFEFIRAMEEVKPKYFLFENVASMNAESKQIISELLGCEPVFINSNCFVAQDRPRLYWTNIPVEVEGLIESSLCLQDILESDVDEKYFYSYPLLNVDMTKQVCATMDFKINEMHKRIFNPKFKTHTLTCVSGGHHQKKVLVNGRARKLIPLEYERLQGLPDGYTEGVSDTHRYSTIGNGWTVDVIEYIFSFLPMKESDYNSVL
jgi:DNA (cytosine-5)-methyltransferase 3A